MEMDSDHGHERDVPLYESEEVPARPARHVDPIWGAARLAKKSDLIPSLNQKLGQERLRMHATPLVEATADGSQLTPLPYHGFELSDEDLDRHLLCIAQTGDGKTLRFIAQVVLAILALTKRTLFVVNSKGPWFTRVVMALARRFRPAAKCMTMNMVDPKRSCAWNRVLNVTRETDAFRIASALCDAVEVPGARNDSPFWRQSSIELLAGMLLTSEVKSLADAWRLTRLPVAAFADFAAKYPHIPQLNRFADFIRTGSHNAETILQDLAIRLATAGVLDPRIRAVTCGENEFDAREFVNRGGGILILEIPEEDAPRLRPLTNLFVTDLFDAVISGADRTRDGQLKTPAAFVFDEFASSVGRVPDFEMKVNTLRSRRAALICATQSLNQLELVYGPASKPLLDGFSSLVTIGSLSESDRQYMSQKSGTMTVRQWTVTEEFDPHSEEFQPKTRSESVFGRQLLLPSDLVRDPHPVFGPLSVVFLPQRPPMLVHLSPAWEIPVLEEAMALASADETLSGRREKPLRTTKLWDNKARVSVSSGAASAPASCTNTVGWTDEDLQEALNKTKAALDWDNTTGSARKWWEAFEQENQHRLALVLRLAEELRNRKATITEFFLAYVYSNTDNIQANLCYLDYTRLKKEEERKKKEAAAKAREAAKDRSSES